MLLCEQEMSSCSKVPGTKEHSLHSDVADAPILCSLSLVVNRSIIIFQRKEDMPEARPCCLLRNLEDSVVVRISEVCPAGPENLKIAFLTRLLGNLVLC